MPELARETTSSFGTSISSVALPLVALSVLHASVFAVTMLTAAAWLPWLLVGLPAGAWLDRLPRRRIMMVADLVSLSSGACRLLPRSADSPSPSWWWWR